VNSPARREQNQSAPVQVNDLMKPLLNLDEAMRVSEVLSLSDMVPRSLYGKPTNVFHVIMTGQALGLHWTEAIRVIFSPGPGQIGMRAQFLLHQVRKAGHRYTIEPGEGSCTVTIKRGDTDEPPFSSTFTIDDAIQGGLVQRKPDGKLVALSQSGKPLPWMQWDKKMLRWRAVTDVVSFAVPEAGLGFEVDGGGGPEPQQPVELHPQTPAPPEPGDGKAAPSDGQAAQAESASQRRRLATMDEQMREGVERDLADHGIEPDLVGEIPESGGESAVQVTKVDPHVGGISESGGESAPSATPEAEAVAPEQNLSPPVDEPGDSPVDTAVKATTKDLAGWFREFGYDPKQYRSRVLNACSVYARRRITGVRDLKLFEVADLCSELSALWDRSETSELAPVSMLAEEIAAWQDSWEREDPDGYTLYTGPQ
jgi:hypothetical protein